MRYSAQQKSQGVEARLPRTTQHVPGNREDRARVGEGVTARERHHMSHSLAVVIRGEVANPHREHAGVGTVPQVPRDISQDDLVSRAHQALNIGRFGTHGQVGWGGVGERTGREHPSPCASRLVSHDFGVASLLLIRATSAIGCLYPSPIPLSSVAWCSQIAKTRSIGRTLASLSGEGKCIIPVSTRPRSRPIWHARGT